MLCNTGRSCSKLIPNIFYTSFFFSSFMLELLFLIAVFATVIATYTDVRTREVPDWLNYSMVAAGLGINALYSLYYSRGEYIAYSILGLGIFFGLGALMFYTGQWGGGDSKYIMGIGALLGFRFSLDDTALSFVANVLLIGAFYGLIWSIGLAIKNRKEFLASWHALRRAAEFKTSRIMLLGIGMVGIIAGFLINDMMLRLSIFALLVMLFFLFYTFLFTKAVEASSMHRWVKPQELTEGDWIVHDVLVGKKRICGPKDLGVSKEQIAELVRLQKKGKIKKVLMKIGIPFVPSFLFALLATWFFGNLLMPVIQMII